MKSAKGLRKEKSTNCSGEINQRAMMSIIPELHNKKYIVKDISLDGDAPKQFIKAYLYEKASTIRKSSKSSWPSYIAKTAEKWYPHESVIEYMINRIGQVLGVKMNDILLVRANDQIRFLSKYFINLKRQKLIHGAEICGEHLGDMLLAKEIAEDRIAARQLFTFEFIRDAIRSVFPNCFEQLNEGLVKMLTFDCLVGNNDRHFYNWGVIDTKKKTSKLPTFAPIYDSARGLLWNFSDENIKNWLTLHKQGVNKLTGYIDGASPRISIEDNKAANHFELIDFIQRYNKEYHKIVYELSTVAKEEEILDMLGMEFFPLFISERNEAIEIIIRERFKKVRSFLI